MKKRMTSLVLALAMCLSLSTTVFAARFHLRDHEGVPYPGAA